MNASSGILPASLLAAFLASAVPGFSAAGPAVPGFDKIEPWVIEHTMGSQEAEFIVVLRDQADLTPAARLRGRAAKGRFVRDALYAKAQETQAPLLRWLGERGIPFQSFYIVNAMLVRGTLATAQAIAARPEVDRIEGNPTIRILEPAPPEASRAAPAAPSQTLTIEPGVSYIRAPDVWAAGYTGQGIVIGSADTGVQWNHPALINHYRGWDGSAAHHDYNWHDSVHSGGGVCGPDSPFPCDDDDHGTHTTGTAVGSDGGANQIGVAPGAKFIACRNMDQGNGTPARYLECMEWFLAPYPVGGTTAQGDPALAPDITTNSWTCPASEGCGWSTLQAGVEAQRAAGIMFVAAAGNSGPSCSSVSDPPGIYDASYTVGAFDAGTGTLASFSSLGPVTVDGSNRLKPDLSAPGVYVRSSVRNSLYATLSGTSMATPHVAGSVALLWSAYPSLRNAIPQTENILDQAAVDVPSSSCSSSGVPNDLYGWGRLDVKAAFDLGPLAVDPANGRAGGSGVWLGTAFPNPAHHSTLLRFRVDRDGDVRLAILSVGGQRVRTLVRRGESAGEHLVRWDGLDDRGDAVPAGLYLARLEATGGAASRKLIWLGR